MLKGTAHRDPESVSTNTFHLIPCWNRNKPETYLMEALLIKAGWLPHLRVCLPDLEQRWSIAVERAAQTVHSVIQRSIFQLLKQMIRGDYVGVRNTYQSLGFKNNSICFSYSVTLPDATNHTHMTKARRWKQALQWECVKKGNEYLSHHAEHALNALGCPESWRVPRHSRQNLLDKCGVMDGLRPQRTAQLHRGQMHASADVFNVDVFAQSEYMAALTAANKWHPESQHEIRC